MGPWPVIAYHPIPNPAPSIVADVVGTVDIKAQG